MTEQLFDFRGQKHPGDEETAEATHTLGVVIDRLVDALKEKADKARTRTAVWIVAGLGGFFVWFSALVLTSVISIDINSILVALGSQILTVCGFMAAKNYRTWKGMVDSADDLTSKTSNDPDLRSAEVVDVMRAGDDYLDMEGL